MKNDDIRLILSGHLTYIFRQVGSHIKCVINQGGMSVCIPLKTAFEPTNEK